MTHWPGVTWREIEQEWTDSQYVMFTERLRERLEKEQEALAEARGEDTWRAKWQPVH